jgi:hypothetical protein
MFKRRLFWLTVWGVCFGYIEAAVVVYLRRIYYPDGFAFPVVMIEPGIAVVELVREAVTLLFLWAVAALIYRTFQCRIAVFMILFGIWDIFYYIFLKAALDWPESLFTWDILFLLPLPWAGPVWAPVLVSMGMIYAGIVVLYRNDKGSPMPLERGFWILEVFAGLVIILSFLIPGQAVLKQTVPTHFPWYIFWTGYLTGITAFKIKQLKSRKEKGERGEQC